MIKKNFLQINFITVGPRIINLKKIIVLYHIILVQQTVMFEFYTGL